MEVNTSNTMGINCSWIGKDCIDSSNWDGQCQCLACRVDLLCDTTDQRIGCTHALIPNWIYCIPFNAKRQMELVGSARPFTSPSTGVPAVCSQASFSAKFCHRFVYLEGEVVLGASLILNASESAFYSFWIGLLCIKGTYVSRRVCTMLFFAVFLVLEFIAWIICHSQQRRLPAN